MLDAERSVSTARAGADSVFGYLERTAEQVPGGVRWQTLSYRNEPRSDAGFWDGVAGIAYFLSEYAAITGSARASDLAAEALRWCLSPERPIDGEDHGLGDSLGRGRAGIGTALLRYAAASGDGEALREAISLAGRMVEGMQRRVSDPGAGVPGLPGPSFLWGTAGQGTFLVRAWERSRNERHLAGAERWAERLREMQLPALFGGHWPPVPGTPLPYAPTGFAPGFAGIGYFFAILTAASGVRQWRETTAHIAEVLTRIAQPDQGGLSWPPALNGQPLRMPNPEVPRCQWCIGAPGVGLFFVRAAAALGDDSLLTTARAAGEATFAYGDARANPSYCHGLAGNAELFVELYRATRDAIWLERARDFAVRAFAYRIAGPAGDIWPADEPGLTAPNFSTGAAGVGHLFLRVLAPDVVPMALG